MNKKILVMGTLLAALISCSTVNTKSNNETDVQVKYNKNNDFNVNRYYESLGNNKINYLDEFGSDDFKLEGTSFLYEGEEILKGTYINPNVVIVKATAKNPTIKLSEEDERYNKYDNNQELYEVVETTDDNNKKTKTVTFLKEHAVFVTLQDVVNNESKEIQLNQKIEVREKPNLMSKTRYEDVKKTDKERVKFSVVSYKDGYEDEQVFRTVKDEETGEENKVYVDYDKYFGYDKYEDLDDLAGLKKVSVKRSVNGVDEIFTEYVDFGVKLKDYDGKYEELLSNLDKVTLKFDNKGNITGGFDNYVVEKLLKYEKATNENPDLKFVTRILDEDKDTVGEHNIVREIIKNGNVIYSKKDVAKIGFPGTTVAVADSAFHDVSPEVDARIIRYTPKSLDIIEEKDKKENNNQGLERPHGGYVIGSMIDEVALGDNYFLNLLVGSRGGGILAQHYLVKGIKREFSGQENDDYIIQNLTNLVTRMVNYVGNTNYEPLYIPIKDYIAKLKEYKELKTKENFEENKDEIMKNYYTELFTLLEEITKMPESEKVKYTDLHFRTISIGTNTGGLNPAGVAKYLPRILEDDKNVKVINMSYGSENTIEDYIAIRDMSEEDKQKATDEYNNNPLYRAAVQAWLYDSDNGHRDIYEKNAPGTIGISSMYKYFTSKDTITKQDFQKLLDLRMLILKQAMSGSEELVNANQDILFVVANGNTRNNSGVTDVDLTEFDEEGNKVIFQDGNKKYSNTFSSITPYINEKIKEEALKKGEEAKYNYGYRKNTLTVVGLASKFLNSGNLATDDISNEWGLSTNSSEFVLNAKYYAQGLNETYNILREQLKKVESNPKLYPKGYKEEILSKIKAIDEATDYGVKTDPNGRPLLMSFSRAGSGKLWTVAAEGSYDFTKRLTEEEKEYNKELDADGYLNTINIGIRPFVAGSSFAAPRVTAVAGEIGTKYPWMSAQQIKTTILTTATDDHNVVSNNNGTYRKGLYGVDENIGWGILNKFKAYRGPARFVRALTHEVGEEDFVANIDSGVYEFSNDIAGGFDILLHMVSRGKLTEAEFTSLYTTKDIPTEYILDPSFETNESTKNIASFMKAANISKYDLLINLPKKVEEYKASLPYEEKELFEDAGLVKKGRGTLVMSGVNTYKDPTVVEEGTLIFRGSSMSPFVVHRGAKLKLDMKYGENINQLIDEDFKSSINAEVINAGEVYSYSEADRILNTYRPLSNSKLYISGISRLEIDNVDLTDVDRFEFDVFRKKGMKVFKAPEYIDDGDIPNATSIAESKETNYDEKLILQIDNVKVSQLYKFKLGTFEFTPYIDIVVKVLDKEGSKDKIVQALLVRKNKANLRTQSEGIEDIRDAIRIAASYATGEEREKMLESLANIEWLNNDEASTLKGEVLSNSLSIGYDLSDIKNRILSDVINNRGNLDKFSVFADTLSSTRFANTKIGERYSQLTGTILGFKYTSKYNTTGIAFNYISAHMFNYNLPISHGYGEEQKYLLGTVKGNNYGVSLFTTFNYNNGYLNSIFSLDYLSKYIDRKIGKDKMSNVDSADYIFTANFEGGYDFKVHKIVNVIPYVKLNILDYLKGSFKENTEFGYSSDVENNLKVNMTLGTKVKVNVTNKFDLGLNLDYTKYLTSPEIVSKSSLEDYKFTKDVKGINLEDNYVTFGVNGIYKLKDGLSFNFLYNNRNIKLNTLKLGLNYEF